MPSLERTRWFFAGLLGALSAVAVVATYTKDGGALNAYVPDIATVIREPGLMLGSAGLGGMMLLRSAGSFLPKPWRVYVDRLEFTFVAMLWILWTSATMAFSAATIAKTICIAASHTSVPQCSVLTIDLLLLHALSLASFAYLLVVLSTALSPGYLASHSPSLEGVDVSNSDGVGGEAGSMFVMWELALGGSAKQSTTDLAGGYETAYGTATQTPIGGPTTVMTEAGSEDVDRFTKGRVGLYVPLLFSSMAVLGSLCAVSTRGFPGFAALLVFSVALLSAAFTITFLYRHRRNKSEDISAEATRKYRAIELGSILALFVLWPIAATLFTLSPSGKSRPCTASPSNDDDTANPDGPHPTDKWLSICNLTLLTLSLAWFCGWIALARAVDLVFPMPDGDVDKPSVGVPILGHSRASITAGREGQPLLSGTAGSQARRGGCENTQGQGREVVRPQVKYGRLVAGEAFELGDEED